MVVVVANLKPRAMKGVISQGMVLCAKIEDGSCIEFLDVPEGTEIGELLTVEGEVHPDPDDVINPGKKGKPSPWEEILPMLSTDGDKIATFNGKPFKTSAGLVTASTLCNVPLN